MFKRGLFFLAACAPALMILGCPGMAPPEAVLEGDWATEDAQGATIYARFDANGQLLGFIVATAQGNALVEVDNSTTVVEGDDVTITVPTPTGDATFTGTLSADENTMDGQLTRQVVVTEDITVTVPAGPVTFERVVQCGNTFCDPGEVCTNGQCVAEAECDDNADCEAGEVCTNGQCVAEAECDDNADCEAGEVCTNGECVPEAGGGDPVAGQAFYNANGCAGCHAADGSGVVGPNIQDATAEEIFANLSGADPHPVTVAGVTQEDAEDVAAWLNSL
jgi:hypothetical protein